LIPIQAIILYYTEWKGNIVVKHNSNIRYQLYMFQFNETLSGVTTQKF